MSTLLNAVQSISLIESDHTTQTQVLRSLCLYAMQ